VTASTPGSYRPRSQARALALQALCVFEALGEAPAAQLADLLRDEELLVELGIEMPPDPALLSFARSLAMGTWAHRPRYDELLERTAAHWSLRRMAPVDRNVLRLGLYELLDDPHASPQVIINEAVELARRFGDKDSAYFVNGVLDAARRSAAGPEGAAEPPAVDADGPAE
jgi:transcription antitermination factor NusB